MKIETHKVRLLHSVSPKWLIDYMSQEIGVHIEVKSKSHLGLVVEFKSIEDLHLSFVAGILEGASKTAGSKYNGLGLFWLSGNAINNYVNWVKTVK